MKFYLTISSLILNVVWVIAQSNGCEIGRYSSNVFNEYTVTTVAYGQNVNAIQQPQTLRMDIYTPDGDDLAERPLIIAAHGGSFIVGVRQDLHELCERFVKKGFVCATIDYRLWPILLLGFPDSTKITKTAFGAISDMKAAVRFFRQSYEAGNPYGIDTSYIVVGGGSAGAITAIHTAYIDRGDALPENVLAEIDLQGGFEGSSGDSINMTYSSKVHSVLNLSGAIFDTSWIRAGEVPIFSIQGTIDETVPYELGKAAGIVTMMGSKLIHARADHVGLENGLISVEGGGHSNIYDEPQFETDINKYDALVSNFWTQEICGITSLIALDQPIQNIKIYPNPSSDLINLILPKDQSIVSVDLFNMQGQQVSIRQEIAGNQAKINFDGPGGMYMAHVWSDKGFGQQKVIFKNK